MRIFCTLLVALTLASCNVPPRMMMTQDYQNRPAISGSLFKSDQDVMSDETINRILTSKLQLPPKAKIALMRFQGGLGNENFGYLYRGFYSMYSEDYLRLQQTHVDTLSAHLLTLPRVMEVTPLPSLLTPQSPTVPILREAAVRLQADLLLIYRITTDVYSEYNTFSKDEAKAYSTCEFVLLDVRTGLIPFTSMTTRDFYTKAIDTDLNLAETGRRAERLASLQSLAISSQQLLDFLKTVP